MPALGRLEDVAERDVAAVAIERSGVATAALGVDHLFVRVCCRAVDLDARDARRLMSSLTSVMPACTSVALASNSAPGARFDRFHGSFSRRGSSGFHAPSTIFWRLVVAADRAT